MSSPEGAAPRTSGAQDVGRLVLAVALIVAGLGHLLWAREDFQAQVPAWIGVDVDIVVVASGVMEIALGTMLVVARQHRAAVGWATAAFFVLIFPGNIAQYMEGADAFGLDSDGSRAARLALQPVLVAAALWATGAWSAWRARGRA